MVYFFSNVSDWVARVIDRLARILAAKATKAVGAVITSSGLVTVLVDAIGHKVECETWWQCLLQYKPPVLSVLLLLAAVLIFLLRWLLVKSSFARHYRNMRNPTSPMNQEAQRMFAKVPKGGIGSTATLWVRRTFDQKGFCHPGSGFKATTLATPGAVSGGINHRAFKGTPWSGTEKEKTDRNTAHLNKNDACIHLLGSEVNGELRYYGFTHVIPVTNEGLQDYLNGHIKDSTFDPKYIARPDSAPAALILFSFALDPEQRDVPGQDPETELMILLRGHLAAFLKDAGGSDPMRLIAQIDRAWVRNWMKEYLGFSATKYTCGDGNAVLEAYATLNDW